jgi:hypothetical protein
MVEGQGSPILNKAGHGPLHAAGDVLLATDPARGTAAAAAFDGAAAAVGAVVLEMKMTGHAAWSSTVESGSSGPLVPPRRRHSR